ncbi:hypothetical protein CMI42_06365 [Candidatus Pacearchaeota archaeon]|nr:hypothetical protein [Candidatus Pacearchaeota archaeon]
MKKVARDLKEGDDIRIADKSFKVLRIEISEIGKHGKSKVRIEAENNGDKIVIIRPDDYPFELL